jgi:hypothetical protein
MFTAVGDQTPGEHVLYYIRVCIGILADDGIEEEITRLVRQADPGYAELIKFVTYDVLDARRPAQPNLNFHLRSDEVLRWQASHRDLLLYSVADWEEEFEAARLIYNSRYQQKSFFMILVRGEWGHQN